MRMALLVLLRSSMLIPPQPHKTWDPVRQVSYQQAEGLLRGRFSSVKLRLTTLDKVAMIGYGAWKAHSARGARRWPWPSLVHDFRHADPACFEVAIWSGNHLCGMALGDGDEALSYCSVWYMEADPREHHLKGEVLDIVLTTLVVYTALLGRSEVRLVDPSQHVQKRALAHRSGSYSLVHVPGQRQYLRRSIP
jgi:hypothetical protein